MSDSIDSALAAVLREQTEKAEVEAHARKVRVRRQGLGLRHLTLPLVTATALWIWIWPPAVPFTEYLCDSIFPASR